MKKQAYQTYYRDPKTRELKVQLVDAITGQPVKNPKEYTVIDSTTGQGTELAGFEPPKKAPGSTGQNFSSKPTKELKKSATGDKRDPEKTSISKSTKGTAADDFGWQRRPSWTKYAPTVAGLVSPIAGVGLKAASMGWDARNLTKINEAREAFGLKPMSNKEFAKSIVKGDDVGAIGDVDIGNGANRLVGMEAGDAVIDGRTTMTPREAQSRRALASVQESAARNKANPQSRLHPEIDPGFQSGPSRALAPRAEITASGPNVTYSNQNAQRNERLNPDVEARLSKAIEGFFGPGFHADVVSGKGVMRDKSGNPSKKGNHNHPLGTAGDFDVIGPDGQKVDSSTMGEFGAYAAANHGFTGIGGPSIGYMGAGRMHLDTNHAGLATWGGAPTGQIAAAVDRGFGFPGPGAPVPADRPSIQAPGIATPDVQMASLDTPEAIESYVREAAIARNIDPDVAVAVAKSEGLGATSYQSLVDTPAGKEQSFGPFQLNTEVGLGIDFQKVTGLDPKDPKNIKETIDFALDNAAEHKSWGPFHGAKRVGIAEAYGLENANPLGYTKPAEMVDVKADPFEKYSKSFYEAVQKQPDVSKTVGPTGNMGRMDSPSSGRPSFGSNRPATDSPSEGGSRFGGSGLGSPSSFGSSYSGMGGQNSPSEGRGRFGGSGLGNQNATGGTASRSYSNADSPSESGGRFGGRGLGTPDKDKDKDGMSQGPSGGGYGGWGGPR